MNLDPLAEAYVNTSPLAYAYNNPVFFIDPDGMRVDVSGILRKDKKGNYVHKELAEAFIKFAKSDTGIEFLSKFVARGQTIAGHKYKKAGQYHQEGTDLYFGAANLNSRISNDSDTQGDTGSSGITRLRGGKYVTEIRQKAVIDIYVNSELNTNRKEAKNYSENKKNPKARTLFVLQRMSTILHEIVIHADSYARDLSDNCKINCSDEGNKDHINAKKPGSLFLKKVLPVMIKEHRRSKTNLSEKEIKKRLLKFSN